MIARTTCYRLVALSLSFILYAPQILAQATDVDCAKCVDQTDLAQKSVSSGKLANDAVTDSKLDDRAVTTDQLKGSAVTQGKIKDEAITTAKIRNGAVTLAKVSPELANSIDTYCMPGQVAVGKDGDGNWICEAPTLAPASCAELEYDATIWDGEGAGLDLRTRTNSTLHFIGCNDNGCESESFYCNYDKDAGTLAFGSTSEGSAMRVLIDPDNAARGDMSGNEELGCCSAEFPDQLCNAPLETSDVTALCNALGYANGSLVRSTTGNACPKAGVVGDDAKDWSSDFGFSDGSGMEYLCSN